MRLRMNLLPQFNHTLMIRIGNPKIVGYEKHETYTTLLDDKKNVVGYNIENFDYPAFGRLEITEDLLARVNQILDTPLTHDFNPYLVVGKVLTCEKHPHSDHLKVCKVDVKDEVLQIVCGAHNVSENVLVVVAKEHAIIKDMYIEKGTLLKVASEGMLCSAYELDLIQEKKKGLLLLDESYIVGENFVWKGDSNV